MRNAKGRRQRKQPKKKKKKKKKKTSCYAQMQHIFFCFLSCLKTMQKSVERAKKKKKAYKNRMEIPHKFMK